MNATRHQALPAAAPRVSRATPPPHPPHYTLYIPHYTLAVCALALAFNAGMSASAQTAFAPAPAFAPPSQLVTLVGGKPIVLEAPRPFVEVSRILPDLFAQRAQAIAAANRLLAWYVPAQALKDQLNDKPIRPRALQVQVMRDMEPVRYDAKAFDALRAQTLSAQRLPQISEDDTDSLFALLDLTPLTKRAGGQRILATANLGPDSFTLCIATSTEGSDQLGGREIEASVSCITYLLINEKIILLTVSGPDLSAKELRNTMRLTREWIALLRANNNAK